MSKVKETDKLSTFDAQHDARIESMFLGGKLANCYKILWLRGFIDEVVAGRTEIPYRNIVARMMAAAWAPVLERDLSLGSQDKLTDCIIYAWDLLGLSLDATEEEVYQAIVTCEDAQLKTLMKDRCKHVPQHLIRVFFEDKIEGAVKQKGSNLTDAELRHAVIVSSMANPEAAPYSMCHENNRLFASKSWTPYLKANKRTLRKWLDNRFYDYLKLKNPQMEVEEAAVAAEPEKSVVEQETAKEEMLDTTGYTWQSIISHEEKPLVPLIDKKLKNDLNAQEEGLCLAKIEAHIDAAIRGREEDREKSEEMVSRWVSIDSEDRERIRIERYYVKRYTQQIEQYREDAKNPYFGHLDMRIDDDETRSFFVGEKVISDGGKVIVLDWRDPVGNSFYRTQETSYKIKDHKYDLLLRRRVSIKNGILAGLKNEYDASDEVLGGKVIDEFLISVLKDKRRDYKLTDIIKTIQSNQNDIITLPLEANFVVQGCAGSGKTMILLHRLSYLAFNYPEIQFSKYLTVTPNESFNVHIDELSQKLGLDKITRLTPEALYERLISEMSQTDTHAIQKGGKSVEEPKVLIAPEKIVDERCLGDELLSYVYSMDFQNELIQEFNALFEQGKAGLEEIDIDAIVQPGTTGGLTGEAPFVVYHRYAGNIRRMLRDHEEAVAQIDKLKTEIADIDEKNEELAYLTIRAKQALAESRTSAVEAIAAEMANYEKQRDTYRETLNNCKQTIEKSQAAIEKLNQKADELQSEYDQIVTFSSQLVTYKTIMGSETSVGELLRERCASTLAEIERKNQELDTVGLFGFARRRAIRDNISEVTAQLKAEAAAVFNELLAGVQEKLDESRAAIAEVTEAQVSAQATTDSIEEARAALLQYGRALSRLEKFFEDDKYPKGSEIPNDSDKHNTYRFASDYVAAYGKLPSNQRAALERGHQNIAFGIAQRDQCEYNIDKWTIKLLPPVEEKKLMKAREAINALDVMCFEKKLMNMLDGAYYLYDSYPSDGVSTRHQLYLWFLMCSYYYGGLKNTGFHLDIDEAQDLALSEYHALNRAFGPKTTYNLYGDLNQLVYDFKGIRSWEEVSFLTQGDTRYLKENYRNTLQITTHCNESLQLDTTAIGINGAEVVNLGLNAALEKLFAVRAANPYARLAVIHKNGLQGLRDALKTDLGNDAVWGYVVPEKISVINVEQSKGLEFDGCVVLTNGMTKNELYISYTRALDNLILTALPNGVVGKIQATESVVVAREVSPKERKPAKKKAASKAKKPAATKSAKEKAEEPARADSFADLFADIDQTVIFVSD